MMDIGKGFGIAFTAIGGSIALESLKNLTKHKSRMKSRGFEKKSSGPKPFDFKYYKF